MRTVFRWIALVAGMAILSWMAVADDGADALSQALRTVQDEAAIRHNALYLFLRLAGIVWIAMEWVAAILLWRGYRLLKDAVRRKGLAP